ncbi:hypothetical protein HYV43_07045 [Candidatus Micrarchaeota archaeon]|nr:hypothetical protein [Candidatus Micrarchaeota archaeon]
MVSSFLLGIDVPMSLLQQPSAYSKGLMVGTGAAALFLGGLWLLARGRAPEKN